MDNRVNPTKMPVKRLQEITKVKKYLSKLRLEMRGTNIQAPETLEERLHFIEKKFKQFSDTTHTHFGHCEVTNLQKNISHAWSELYDVFHNVKSLQNT